MGLLDILNGMQSGSGQSQQRGTGGSGMMVTDTTTPPRHRANDLRYSLA